MSNVADGQSATWAALEHADDLLRRLAEWDVMQVTADGPYWKREIARVRAEVADIESPPVPPLARSDEHTPSRGQDA